MLSYSSEKKKEKELINLSQPIHGFVQPTWDSKSFCLQFFFSFTIYTLEESVAGFSKF